MAVAVALQVFIDIDDPTTVVNMWELAQLLQIEFDLIALVVLGVVIRFIKYFRVTPGWGRYRCWYRNLCASPKHASHVAVCRCRSNGGGNHHDMAPLHGAPLLGRHAGADAGVFHGFPTWHLALKMPITLPLAVPSLVCTTWWVLATLSIA